VKELYEKTAKMLVVSGKKHVKTAKVRKK